MNQPNLEKLVNKLRYNVKPRRKLRNPQGLEGRLLKLRKTLTALIKYERLELNYPRGDEARGYVDQVHSLFFNYYLFQLFSKKKQQFITNIINIYKDTFLFSLFIFKERFVILHKNIAIRV